MEHINYKELYESLLAENIILKSELNDSSSIIQILYTDMDELNSQLIHYKDMFSAANTNLMVNDKEVYDLNEFKNNIIRENTELTTRLENQTKEIDDLKETTESNREFINSYYKVNNNSISTQPLDNPKIGGDSELEQERYELVPIDKITDWIIDYINSGCTFTLMNKHHLSIKLKRTNKEKELIVNYKRVFKNNKWTLRVFLKLFFTYHFPSQLNRLYASETQQNETCTICYNKAVDPCILTCECKHIYCYKCINKWVSKNKSGCPCCRKRGTIFEAGPITPMNYRVMIDNKYSASSIPQHFRIFV
jgi:hypothetical protein